MLRPGCSRLDAVRQRRDEGRPRRTPGLLWKALTEFVEHGRRVKADRSASARNRKRPVPRTGPSPAAVREWAAAQGIAVSPRGRISADVVAQYEAAQPG